MKKKVILSAFQPYKKMIRMFNDKNIYYGNCYYSAYLAVANSLNRDIVSILNNVIYVYRYNEERLHADGYFNLEAVDVNSLESVLSGVGIEVVIKFPGAESLKEEIIRSISCGNPVAVCIDLYYQPGRTLWYKTKHGGGHLLLVYGYDLGKNEVYTIDDVTGCNKYTLTFDELYSCYNGQFEYCDFKPGESELFFEFIVNPEKNIYQHDHKSTIDPHVQEFVNNLLSYKEQILPSLEGIPRFADVFEIVSQREDIAQILQRITYGKMAEQFRLVALKDLGFDFSNAHAEIHSLLTAIIRDWDRVRMSTAKAIYANTMGTEKQNQIADKIKGLYVKESKYYELLFDLASKFV